MSELKVMRGDIFYVQKYGYQIGSEQQSGRPAVIVSNDKNNEHSSTIEIVYCTTQPKEDLPTHCTIRSTSVVSTVLCEQVTTVDKQRLGDFIGVCTEEEMNRIENAIRISLGLNDKYEQYNPFAGGAETPKKATAPKSVEKQDEDSPTDQGEIASVRVERDVYKNLYENLLNRVLAMSKV